MREGETEGGGRGGGRRDIQLSNREAKCCNLFWHNRLNRLQIEEYSVLGASPHHPPPQLICHEAHECADQSAKRERERCLQEIQHLKSFWVYVQRRRRGLVGIIDVQMKSLGWGMKECPFFYFGHHKRHTCVLIQLSKKHAKLKVFQLPSNDYVSFMWQLVGTNSSTRGTLRH